MKTHLPAAMKAQFLIVHSKESSFFDEVGTVKSKNHNSEAILFHSNASLNEITEGLFVPLRIIL